MPIALPKDDLVHVPGANPGWRESYYFDFYDERLGFGIWNSIGKKPYKGYSGYTIGIWGKDLVLCGVGRDRFTEHTEEHQVEGLKYECLVPNEKWRLTFEGQLVRPERKLRIDPNALLPGKNKGLPLVPVQFDLVFSKTSSAYLYHQNPEWKHLFDGHIDQTGRTTGQVTIGDETYTVDGLGVRDRSWGTRDWQWPQKWRYVHLPSPEMNLVFWYVEGAEQVTVIDGFVEIGNELSSIIGYSEEVFFEPMNPKPIPKSFRININTKTWDTITLQGEVMQIMPVVFSKKKENQTIHSWNDRSLVRFQLPNGKVAYGNIEFSERIVEG